MRFTDESTTAIGRQHEDINRKTRAPSAAVTIVVESATTLFWVMASVATGLLIGQLS